VSSFFQQRRRLEIHGNHLFFFDEEGNESPLLCCSPRRGFPRKMTLSFLPSSENEDGFLLFLYGITGVFPSRGFFFPLPVLVKLSRLTEG